MYQSNYQMNRTAIVTGAAGNMGKALVARLLEENYKVIGTALSGESCGEHEKHPQFSKFEIDVTNPEAVEGFIMQATDILSEINFAALLVGGFDMNSFENTSLDEIHKMFKLNFESAFVCSQALFRQMKKQPSGGKIVMIGAKPAIEKGASSGMTAYALSKSLIFKLAENINAEGAEFGINASVVVPSVLDTPPNRNAMPDADFSKWVKPEDIAEVMAFIASDASSSLRESVYKTYADV
jgi:NAD(P)-dependent dehydrogenase (short-subunit alcohol dehydrogenase family)